MLYTRAQLEAMSVKELEAVSQAVTTDMLRMMAAVGRRSEWVDALGAIAKQVEAFDTKGRFVESILLMMPIAYSRVGGG